MSLAYVVLGVAAGVGVALGFVWLVDRCGGLVAGIALAAGIAGIAGFVIAVAPDCDSVTVVPAGRTVITICNQGSP